MKKLKILITDTFFTELLNKYKKKNEITYYPNIKKSHLIFIISQFDILIISTRIPITNEIIDKAINLKLIIRMGTGVDHIDLISCKNHKIIVCNTPDSNISSVVELVFGQIIRHLRNFDLLNKNVFSGKFRKDLQHGEELKSKTIGIIGVGRIGSKISNIAKSFGMKVLGNDPYLSKSKRKKLLIDKWLSKKKLVSQSDIVTLHVPLTDKTQHMVNKEFLSWMKKDSILVNTARGKVVKMDEVIEFAKQKKVKKFIFDVFEEEPFIPNIDKNITKYFYFSPHAAAYTKESIFNRSKEALEEIDEFLQNKKPHGKINFKKGY